MCGRLSSKMLSVALGDYTYVNVLFICHSGLMHSLFSDDLSPAPRFHMSFRVQNQAGVALRVLTSDNDPPDGFKLEPEDTSIITKEVSNPSDLSIHAVVPGEEKSLLVNGLQNLLLSPSAAPGDPYVMKITGKGGESFVV